MRLQHYRTLWLLTVLCFQGVEPARTPRTTSLQLDGNARPGSATPGFLSGLPAMLVGFCAADRCAPCTAWLTYQPAAQDGMKYRIEHHKRHRDVSVDGQAVGGGQEDSKDGPPDHFLIRVMYSDSYEQEGWDRLEVTVNAAIPIPDVIKAHAAGYAEAYFQAERMHHYWTNYRLNEFAASDGVLSDDLLEYVRRQSRYVRQHVATKSGGSKYWRLMGLVMAQFDGLCEGYWRNVGSPSRNMTWEELYLLQSVGDLYDLNVLYPPGKQDPSIGAAAGAGATAGRQYSPGHGQVGPYGYGEELECSALIKLEAPTANDTSAAASSSPGVHSSALHPLAASAGTGERGQRSAQAGAEAVTGAGRLGGLALGRTLLAEPRQQLFLQAATARVKQWVSGWLGPGTSTRTRTSTSTRTRTNTTTSTSTSEIFSQAAPGTVSEDGRRKESEINFWAGHNTWRPYYAMIRTWKVYNFPWSETGPLTISSSPGLLFSKDDWYTTDKLVIMETTNGVYNKTLYDLITHTCALMWQRVQVANLGATSGREWVELFKKHNSGTYNNQWMVLDVAALQKGWGHDVLWVLEQLPGLTEQADVTAVLLQQGYWASYNVPYFPRIYNISGYPAEQDLYHSAARARIFEREQSKVTSLAAFKKLMRFNRYQKDPLAEGRPNNAIAARYDLPVTEGAAGNWTRKAFGAVDAKLVDAASFRRHTTHVICGPTTDDQKPFRWSASPWHGNVSHAGAVDLFEFDWQAYTAMRF